MGNILHTATSLIPPEEPLMAFENRFSTSEKLFKACSSLSRDRRGWVYLSVLLVKGRSRHTALGLSFSITAYQALASLISVLSMLHPNKWSKACVSLWSDISTLQIYPMRKLTSSPTDGCLLVVDNTGRLFRNSGR
jgi:hypothetical protein